jgi:hypothetical protein
MTAESLVRLYPRAWRDRYGEEFLATVGQGALRLQQVIDIVAGAIDAWLSSEMRRAGQPAGSPHRGPVMSHTLKSAVCGGTKLRFSNRDALIGAGVMIGTSFVCLALGLYARRSGMLVTGEILKSLAFPGSMILSLPFWMLKGQPWKAQAVLIGGTLLFLVLIGYLSTRI